MLAGTHTERRLEPGDVIFACFLVAYGAISISRIPFDFTDLCYLFSLEQGRWAPQEWVHPIYVPTLRVLSGVLALFGYHGHMLVPVELLNVAAATTAFVLLYRLARRFPGSSLAAAVALGVTALCTGFWHAAVRPTPYAPALLCQTLALSLLVSENPVPPRRYALAGVLAALSMGFHAAAMALAPAAVVCACFEPDPERTPRATFDRILAFGTGMLATAAACWMVFVTYNGIGLSYFRDQDFWSAFTTIEQVPNTSIYTSGSVTTQLSSYAATMSFQAGVLVRLAIVLAIVVVLRRLRTPATPFEHRLTTTTAANFAAVTGFFLINNTHNGFNFASLTLVPVLLAVTIRDSWVGLAALVLLAVPGTDNNIIRIVNSGAQGANDPQLAEVRFLQTLLGPRDVLITPGSPFPEMLYLSHVNVVELSAAAPSHPAAEVPVVRPGAVLRARIAWWLAHGARVIYALGDESTDFTGDVTGAEKEHQIFWRPEIAARERAPALRGLRVALEAAGLEVREGLASPRGCRYAEIRLREPSAPIAPLPVPATLPSPDELRALFLSGTVDGSARELARRAQFLAELDAAIPDDPWRSCDVMDLVCQGQPRRDGRPLECLQLPHCDTRALPPPVMEPASDGTGGTCFWGPVADRKAVEEYVTEWVRNHGLGQLSNWGLEVNREAAKMTVILADGTLVLKWHLLDGCIPSPVDAQTSDGLSADAISADQLHELVAGLPVQRVRPILGPNHR